MENHPLRSSLSTEKSYVLFLNKTDHLVSIYWNSYTGDETFYTTILPDATCKVNTFRLHPWTFRNHMTGEPMHVGHKSTFWPEPYLMRNPRNLSQWIPCRKQIIIHLPLISLKDSCMWRVLNLLVDASGSSSESHKPNVELVQQSCETAIEKLELPRTVKLDLQTINYIHVSHTKCLS